MKTCTRSLILIGCSLLMTMTLVIAPVSSSEDDNWNVDEGTKVVNALPIDCFQCNSWTNESCAQLGENVFQSPYLKPCVGTFEGKQPFCRKTVQIIKNNPPRVIRSCGWKRHNLDCYHTDDDHHVENVCQCYTNACNSAPRRHVALAAAATLLAIATLLSTV